MNPQDQQTVKRLTQVLVIASVLAIGWAAAPPEGQAAVTLPGEDRTWEHTIDSVERTAAGECDSYGAGWYCKEQCDFGEPTGTFRCFAP